MKSAWLTGGRLTGGRLTGGRLTGGRLTGGRWTGFAIALSFLAAGAAIAVWALSSVDHLAIGASQKSFEVDCNFDKFRQILVRKDATRAIVTRSGMRLIDEQIDRVQLDTSHDKRPLLNALRGKTQSELAADKEITVSLDDPALKADQLVLSQHADIQPQSIQVVTRSTAPAGNLESYETTLSASPQGSKTQLKLTVTMQVHVTVPKAFTHRADVKVQQAADHAIEGQAQSLEGFVSEYADKLFILPDLKQQGAD